ncbi:unnamed protein product [Eruca vesicaria subsp. sativa]|uniref:Uncharacterized protein n=1 Tax=Eruca vesicaria subsp. sativa TaxID=29727 RepID=A0ABC8M1Q7_ERUVS|nr:unnamed protein product [Eruca vesicaria subsp. sativa]
MGNCLRHDNGLAGKREDYIKPELPVELLEEGNVSTSEEEERERSMEGEYKMVRIKVVVRNLDKFWVRIKIVAETSPGLVKKKKKK